MRTIQIIHSLPGRLRLRASWLREDRAAAAALGDRIAELAGVLEVKVRPHTGSVLIHFDPARLDAGRVIDAAAGAGDAVVLAAGESPPSPPAPATSAIAREAARFFRELDRDVLRATEGRTDLGTLTTLGFIAAGVAEVAMSGKLPMPPWFNLAWWGFRAFMTLEQEEIAASGAGAGHS